MKILHIIKTADGATWAIRQIRELIALGHEIHIILPEGKYFNDYIEVGAKVHTFPKKLSMKNMLNLLINSFFIRKIVKEISPDIVHSHFVLTTLMMRLSLINFNIPKVFQVPGPLHLESSFFKKVDLLSSNKHDYWLASCEWVRKEYIKSGINEKKVGLSYYGVDNTFFEDEKKIDLREELSLSKEVPLIGLVAYFYAPKKYLGQEVGIKGHEDLIDAMDLILKKYPNAKCVFIGSAWAGKDWYYNKVKEYALKKIPNSVYFLGYRSDVKNIYNSFDVAVHPSYSENVGGALESLARKVPTVTTNIGGFPDLVINNETGLTVEVNSPSEISEKVCYLLENKEEANLMAQRGYLRAKEKMNVKTNAYEVSEFYNKVKEELK